MTNFELGIGLYHSHLPSLWRLAPRKKNLGPSWFQANRDEIRMRAPRRNNYPNLPARDEFQQEPDEETTTKKDAATASVAIQVDHSAP